MELHHLALRTRDVERLSAFYLRWFRLIVVRDAMPRAVWLSTQANAVLMIELAETDELPYPNGSRELHAFAISNEERPQRRAQLVEAGLLEAETEHTLYFRDPDGRRVALSSFPL